MSIPFQRTSSWALAAASLALAPAVFVPFGGEHQQRTPVALDMPEPLPRVAAAPDPEPQSGPGGVVGGQAPAGPQVGSFLCTPSIRDQETGDCLSASSAPVLGSLYPLGPELNIAADGKVGVGTTNPEGDLGIGRSSISSFTAASMAPGEDVVIFETPAEHWTAYSFNVDVVFRNISGGGNDSEVSHWLATGNTTSSASSFNNSSVTKRDSVNLSLDAGPSISMAIEDGVVRLRMTNNLPFSTGHGSATIRAVEIGG